MIQLISAGRGSESDGDWLYLICAVRKVSYSSLVGLVFQEFFCWIEFKFRVLKNNILRNIKSTED